MRRLVLAGVATTGLWLSTPAHAQFVCANCYSEVTGVLHDLKELAQLVTEYEELVSIYQQVANSISSGSFSPSLLNGVIRNPMLGAQYPGILPGQTFTGTGTLGPAAGMASQLLQGQTVFQAHGTDFAGTIVNQRAASLAGLQAASLTYMDSAQQRLLSLQELEASLDGSPNINQTEAVNARINQEKQALATQQQQAQQLIALAQMQDQVERNQYAQKQRADAENMYNSLQAIGADSTPGLPPSSPPAFISSNVVPFGGG
jgi:hypothetical protein